MQGGNNLIGNRLRRGRLERQTREQPRRRGKRGRQRKRSGRGETFYLGEECMIYVRVKKEKKREYADLRGRAEEMVVVENQGDMSNG
jgi:hypothetical protein